MTPDDAALATKLHGFVLDKNRHWVDFGAKVNDPARPRVRASFSPTTDKADCLFSVQELTRIGLRAARAKGIPLERVLSFAIDAGVLEQVRRGPDGISGVVTFPDHFTVLSEDPNP